MKTLGSSIAIAVLAGFLTVGASAQETGNQLSVPQKASVTAKNTGELHPFQVFNFLVRFSPAPDGYGEGKIVATFKNEGGPPSFERYSRGGMFSVTSPVTANEPLHDSQAIYQLKLTIPESMSPGKWTLKEISIGQSNLRSIPFSEDVFFVVAAPQPLKVHLDGPRSVEAGNVYTFTVTLERYPSDVSMHCRLELWPHFKPREGDSTKRGFDLQPTEITKEQLTYKFSHPFEPDFLSGPWEVVVEDWATNFDDVDMGCWYPQLQGDASLAFNIEPAKHLVIPTLADVTVNPSQVDLLRAEAERLRAEERNLRKQLASENSGAHQVVLQTGLDEALKDLERTKNSFIGLQKDMELPYQRVVNTFFDDIGRTYDLAQRDIASTTAELPRAQAGLRQIHYAFSGLPTELDRAANEVLESFKHNAAAYDIVASTKSLTFTLEVDSRPDHATISYKLRGDDYRPVPHETDWRIENLVRAVYFVRVQKKGYEEQEKTIDAATGTATSIIFDLKRKSSKQ